MVHELLCDDVKLDNDEDIFGDNMEIIDEFKKIPFFSSFLSFIFGGQVTL